MVDVTGSGHHGVFIDQMDHGKIPQASIINQHWTRIYFKGKKYSVSWVMH
jgi:hypothetical protein